MATDRRRQWLSLAVLGLLIFLNLQKTTDRSDLYFQSSQTGSNLRRTLAGVLQPRPGGGDEIRYVTFGTSNTWGIGIWREDKIARNQEAYPYLLSNQVTNAAGGATGHMMNPAYAAVCTQTLIGDDPTDVIILEFPFPAEGVMRLALRLRQRFPRALIVLLDVWDFFMIYTFEPKDTITTREGKQKVRYKHLGAHQFRNNFVGRSVPVQSEAFRAAVKAWPRDFYWVDRPNNRQRMQDIANRIDGVILSMDRPDNATEALLYYSHWFGASGHELSKHGHSALARHVQNFVRSQDVTELDKDVRNEVGAWDFTLNENEKYHGDSCHLWYMNGDVSGLTYSGHVQLQMFADPAGSYGERWALEIPTGGTVTIENPFSTAHMLHLTYMASSQPGFYPKMEVDFVGAKVAVILDPRRPDGHMPRTTAVGYIQPGRTILQFETLAQGTHPFLRLTGASLFGIDDLPVEYNLELLSA